MRDVLHELEDAGEGVVGDDGEETCDDDELERIWGEGRHGRENEEEGVGGDRAGRQEEEREGLNTMGDGVWQQGEEGDGENEETEKVDEGRREGLVSFLSFDCSNEGDIDWGESKVIGKGAYGVVYEVRLHDTLYALKFQKSKRKDTECWEEVCNELQKIKQLSRFMGDTTCKMMGQCYGGVKHRPCILLEYCAGGSLLSNLIQPEMCKDGKIMSFGGLRGKSKAFTRLVLQHVVCVLNTLHEKVYIHGDLHTGNILSRIPLEEMRSKRCVMGNIVLSDFSRTSRVENGNAYKVYKEVGLVGELIFELTVGARLEHLLGKKCEVTVKKLPRFPSSLAIEAATIKACMQMDYGRPDLMEVVSMLEACNLGKIHTSWKKMVCPVPVDLVVYKSQRGRKVFEAAKNK